MLAVVLLIRLRREQADFCNFEQYPSRVSTLPTCRRTGEKYSALSLTVLRQFNCNLSQRHWTVECTNSSESMRKRSLVLADEY